MTIVDLDNVRLDEVLRTFDSINDGLVPTKVLLDEKDAPPDWRRAVEFLIEEGYLKEYGDWFEITYRGKAMLHKGGFVKEHRIERTLFYCTVIAAVCSFFAFVVAVVALVC